MAGRFHARRGQSWLSQRTIVPVEERTSGDGAQHRSKAERHRWGKLKLLEQAGVIRNLHREVTFPLQRELPDGEQLVIRSLKSGRPLTYTLDFVYERRVVPLVPAAGDQLDLTDLVGAGDPQPTWEWVLEDWKGYLDETQKLRIATFQALYGVKVFLNSKP